MTEPDFPQLRGLGRSYDNLKAIYKVRLRNKMLSINSASERAKLYILVIAELNAEAPLAKWVKQAIYEDPSIFDKMNLESPDTILKDNRELEKAGFFSKPEKQAKAEKPLNDKAQLTFTGAAD